MSELSNRQYMRPQRSDVCKKSSVKVVCSNVVAAMGAVACFGLAGITQAAEIRALVALGFKDVAEDIAPRFERAGGHKLVITFANFNPTLKMAQGAEPADIVIMPRRGINSLIKEGKATKESAADLARSEIVVFVRKGAAKPDVSTPDALKRSLLAAKSITYSDPAGGGASAVHFAKVIDQLGIAKELKPKTVYAKPGRDNGDVVAAGKAELGVNQLQVVMPVSGIDIAGPLPGNLQSTTIFASAILSRAANAAGAQALVKFLRSAEGAKVIKAKGMNPA